MDIQYVGEHLLPGQLGQFFVILCFGTALLSFIAYYFATSYKEDQNWFKIARVSFWLNSVAVIGIGCCLYYIIYNHYFEYHYAWAHSSMDLPTHFVISSFWEGQEGSFWLWMFWQMLMGIVLVFKAKDWESPVMTFVMLCQLIIASMLLGIEIFGERVGSSPFILLRDAMEAPIFANPNYLSMIADGTGLNPLLQNYWMVIHPPTLFLGFGAMIVPFAYAAAGLWQRRYKEWIGPGLPWALFAVMTLGAGIIMGSFWAYEALNFGGFWAWDPVENASLIPWLTLIAAAHVMIAFKNSGHSYFTATLLTMISFVLVIYASFLTRSGILGETSVHSFTDLGMFWQLVLFNGVFFGVMIWLLVARRKEMPISKKEEDLYTREFWLFIGALVLAVACVQIIASTSIPVFNTVFGTNVAPPLDPIAHYNKWQAGFAVVVGLITGFTQFLKYKRTNMRQFVAQSLVALAIALIITAIAVYITKVYTNFMYILIMFSASYALVANARVLFDAIKGKWKLAGSAVAHIGFALLLIGALVAAATNEVISVNSSNYIAVAGFDQVEQPGDNLFLTEGEPVQMGEYQVTYVGDSVAPPNVYYKINYERIDEETGRVKESFQLRPFAQNNPAMGGLIGTPDTRHYLTHDIYTLITAAMSDTFNRTSTDADNTNSFDNYEEPAIYAINVGDTVRYRNGFIVVAGINRDAKVENIPVEPEDLVIGMTLEVHPSDGELTEAEPLFMIKGGNTYDFGKDLDDQGLRFRFTNVMPSQDKLELMVYQKPVPEKRWIVFKAIKFPYINFFWAGTIIMTIGFIMAIFRRNKELKLSTRK